MIAPFGFEYEAFNFPCGERHVRIKDYQPPTFFTPHIEWDYQSNEEILDILLITNALKNQGSKLRRLALPYVPYARQDRINVPGECFSLRVFTQLLNSIGAEQVEIMDPHSDVTPALINNCKVIHQHEIFAPMLMTDSAKHFHLVSPDGGALKKIYKLASIVAPLSVIECSKKRNVVTGEITGAVVHCGDLCGIDCYIVDDICDGGRTFIEIAKELKKENAGKIILMVTHGFFTKGLEVFDGLIDEVYTRKGRVK